MKLQHWPEAAEHTDTCRAALVAWRIRNGGLPAVNDLAAFPCCCADSGGTRKPWRLADEPVQHPSWCVVREWPHPWTECTITIMVPREPR